MPYRIKQFMWNITAKRNEEDYRWAINYLNRKEKDLFDRLSIGEQNHSIRVARLMDDETKNEPRNEIYVKLGLLHDIGKSKYRLNVFKKVCMLFVHKLSKGKAKKYSNIKMIRGYYKHGEIGRTMLEGVDEYSLDFLEAVQNHHYIELCDNELVKKLRECDDIS